jgi:hypothetical protein
VFVDCTRACENRVRWQAVVNTNLMLMTVQQGFRCKTRHCFLINTWDDNKYLQHCSGVVLYTGISRKQVLCERLNRAACQPVFSGV